MIHMTFVVVSEGNKKHEGSSIGVNSTKWSMLVERRMRYCTVSGKQHFSDGGGGPSRIQRCRIEARRDHREDGWATYSTAGLDSYFVRQTYCHTGCEGFRGLVYADPG
jgi:hypothetical protein